ncbi:hypothetical protein TNCV_2672481 [Trichonephila clavipes]|nr:hypothetical protein TNCV_2672481 [Trichonephila clavipes]
MELGQSRGGPCADPLPSPIRDYWGRERGPRMGFKGSARRLTILVRSSASFFESVFYSSSSKIRDRGCGGYRTPTKGDEPRWSLKDGVPESAE